jgi:hypothetical protein
VQRFRLSWLLILALIAASLAPAQAGWFCANGLPCAVAMAPSGSAPAETPACCRSHAQPPCHAQAGRGAGKTLDAARTCHYRGAVQAGRALVSERQSLRFVTPDAAFAAAPQLYQPVTVPTPAWAPDPDGYHPPPDWSSGPSRAPPSA